LIADNIFNMEERRRIKAFNQSFGYAVAEVERLRDPFIRIRFDYLKSFYEETIREPYTPTGLANLLLGQLQKGKLPGDDHNPWTNFNGRAHDLSEDDYLEVLYPYSRLPLSSKEMFIVDFNRYLQTQRVAVKLETDEIKMYWRIA
jgi:hypothetical protein